MTVRTAGVRELPDLALTPGRTFGIYVHVPFCAARCGYCDFNTYTPAELGGANPDSWLAALRLELALAAERLGSARKSDVAGRAAPAVDTVFVGGGTPSLLGGPGLAAVLDAIRAHFTLAPDAEVTTEANPDSVDAAALSLLREGGINRVSFGMQSAVDHVLRVLDRTHDPRRVPEVVAWARDAGFEQISLDLIYGTPGESVADWERSLDDALACEPDHVSAYSLIVEDGTALARQIRRGEVAMPDDDDLADKYLLVDERLSAAGLEWYEVSNWAKDDASRCRHNLLYWTGGDWWGVGPGAHSHVAGVRWWNVKHPTAYAGRLASGASPAAGRETLDAETREVEKVMLEARLASGLAVASLSDWGRHAVAGLIADGLVSPVEAFRGRLVLTLKGRLLADAVVRRILPD